MELYHLHYSTEWSYHVLVIPLDGKQGCFYFFLTPNHTVLKNPLSYLLKYMCDQFHEISRIMN